MPLRSVRHMRYALALATAVALTTGPAVSAAQESSLSGAHIYFVAFEDQERDGVSPEFDAAGVFTLSEANEVIRISDPAQRVFSLLVSGDGGRVAYAAQSDGAMGLYAFTSGPADPAPEVIAYQTGLEGFLRIEDVTNDRVYVTGSNSNGETVLVECSEDCLPILTVGSDSILRFHPTLPYLLIESTASHKAEIFSLAPMTEIATLTSSGGAVNADWSPQQPTVAFLAEGAPLVLFDAVSGESDSIPLQTESFSPQTVKWSRTGRYIQISGTPLEGREDDQPLTLLDSASHEVLTIGNPGTVLTLLNWSPTDQYALVDESVMIDRAIQAQYRLYDLDARVFAATSEAAIGFITPAFSAWSPSGDELAMIGQSRLDGNAGLYLVQIADGVLQTLYNTAESSFTQATAYWLNDRAFLLVMPVTDELETLRGINQQLAVLDRTDGTLTRLTSSALTVVPFTLQVILPAD